MRVCNRFGLAVEQSLYKGLGVTPWLCLKTAQDPCKKGWEKAGSRAPNSLSLLKIMKENVPTVTASKLPSQAKLSSCTGFNKTFFFSFFFFNL